MQIGILWAMILMIAFSALSVVCCWILTRDNAKMMREFVESGVRPVLLTL